ncbi:MAG: DUF1513 domain-containing protein [Pseudomonadota bacterium]
MQRRTFILGGTAAIIASSFATSGCFNSRYEQMLVSTASDLMGNHYVIATTLDGTLISATNLPERGHDTIEVPNKPHHVLVVARRPDRFAMEIDILSGKVTHHFNTTAGRHFYGHGCFSPDGNFFFTSENDYVNGKGVIVVRDTQSYRVITEFSSGGIGPHDMKVLPNGRQLAIANGGIQTHPDYQRMKLNIDTMTPNLSIIDFDSGEVVRRFFPPHNKQSIRHLDVDSAGDIFVGVQWQGSKNEVHPLVYKQSGNSELKPLIANKLDWQRMHQYTASVVANNDSLIVTCPRGDCVSIWDTTTRGLVDISSLKDAAGAVQIDDAFYLSTGHGYIKKSQSNNFQDVAKLAKFRFDNHMMSMRV